MGATFGRTKVWIVGETLTAAALNAEFDNILNNLDPSGVDDASTNLSAMQTTVDPYPLSTPSLATDLAGEIQRLRYLIKQITGEAQWYMDPEMDLATLSGAGIFPSGTKLWFYQNTAPSGWTIDTTPADAVLAVKGGSGAYNVSGGSQAGTWTQPDHTLTTAEIPAHTHTTYCPVAGPAYGQPAGAIPYAAYTYVTSSSTGGGGAHNHGTTWRPLAQVGIICTKD